MSRTEINDDRDLVVFVNEALSELRVIAFTKGMMNAWKNIVEPWQGTNTYMNIAHAEDGPLNVIT